jgi:16S rRNA (cytosine967-C5)-methyltransferase
LTPGARIQATLELLGEIWDGDLPPDTVVDVFFRKRRYAGSSDRRAITGHLYDILRCRARLDWWIARTGSADDPTPRTRLVAELALNGKSAPEQTAVLFSGARHCPEPLSDGEMALADALYGRPLIHRDMPMPVRFEYPDWMDESLRLLWGDGLEMEVSALNQTAPVDLRVNTLKATWEQAHDSLAAENVEAEPTPLSPLGLRLSNKLRLGGTEVFRQGWVEVQDEGSQLVALLVGAEPGMMVVDYCAGAGGKTLALASSMTLEGKLAGRLIACDVSGFRMERMDPRLKRAGARNVQKKIIAAKDDPWVEKFARHADRVLADVPCTNTGLWRRNPEARWRFTPTDLDEICAVQQRILVDAASLVKPGGRLIYSTCSLLREENELQLAWFLGQNSDFQALPIDKVWAETVGGPPPPSGPCLHLSPASTGTDGFFCAVMRRLA